MRVIESWMAVEKQDLDATAVMRKDTKDFLYKMAQLGPEYKMWARRTQQSLTLEVTSSWIVFCILLSRLPNYIR